MIGGGIAVGDPHVLAFLIFGELLEQRLALYRFEIACCFLGLGGFQVIAERLEQRFTLLRFEVDSCFLGVGGLQVIGECLEQGVALPRVGMDILLHGHFVGLGRHLGLF